MPETSSSWSTDANGPCSVRYWMIAAASTGPTPFSVSSVGSSAELMLMSAVGPPATPPVTGAPTGGAAPFLGMRIC